MLAVRLNGPKAAGINLALDFIFPDAGEKIAVTIGNSVLNYVNGSSSDKPDATINMSRQNWNELAANMVTLDDLLDDGRMKVGGNVDGLKDLFGLLDEFEIFFNIVEP